MKKKGRFFGINEEIAHKPRAQNKLNPALWFEVHIWSFNGGNQLQWTSSRIVYLLKNLDRVWKVIKIRLKLKFVRFFILKMTNFSFDRILMSFRRYFSKIWLDWSRKLSKLQPNYLCYTMFRKERERKHKREKKNLCCERLFR
jgi:hypothetical protein